MPDVSRRSVDELLKVVEQALTLRIPAITLFPVIEPSPQEPRCPGKASIRMASSRAASVRSRNVFPEMGIITDVALDPYTTHGQDGLVDGAGYVVNDESLLGPREAGAQPRGSRGPTSSRLRT